ncbi:hypothetical protein [Microcoleus sp. D2_18a_D3]|uniref:hypothetical protein n=1 Tax=Microcoleus sp. D2_18a_D3 TaxID=3055330 RepID=UPI002FD053B4
MGEHLNESSPPLEIGARSQESGVRRKEEEGRRKEEEGRSHNKCFYKYEMLPVVGGANTPALSKMRKKKAIFSQALGYGNAGAIAPAVIVFNRCNGLCRAFFSD